eukprot:gene11091-18705_t
MFRSLSSEFLRELCNSVEYLPTPEGFTLFEEQSKKVFGFVILRGGVQFTVFNEESKKTVDAGSKQTDHRTTQIPSKKDSGPKGFIQISPSSKKVATQRRRYRRTSP